MSSRQRLIIDLSPEGERGGGISRKDHLRRSLEPLILYRPRLALLLPQPMRKVAEEFLPTSLNERSAGSFGPPVGEGAERRENTGETEAASSLYFEMLISRMISVEGRADVILEFFRYGTSESC
jgi:hypothetical protein